MSTDITEVVREGGELPPVLAFTDVEKAWELCAAANPTEPPGYAMCADAAAIADVFANMLAYRLGRIEAAALKPAAKNALARWWPRQ
jgi:hypothetical protein